MKLCIVRSFCNSLIYICKHQLSVESVEAINIFLNNLCLFTVWYESIHWPTSYSHGLSSSTTHSLQLLLLLPLSLTCHILFLWNSPPPVTITSYGKLNLFLILNGQNLFGYLDGTIPPPPQSVTSSADSTQTVLNPEFLLWLQQIKWSSVWLSPPCQRLFSPKL